MTWHFCCFFPGTPSLCMFICLFEIKNNLFALLFYMLWLRVTTLGSSRQIRQEFRCICRWCKMKESNHKRNVGAFVDTPVIMFRCFTLHSKNIESPNECVLVSLWWKFAGCRLVRSCECLRSENSNKYWHFRWLKSSFLTLTQKVSCNPSKCQPET